MANSASLVVLLLSASSVRVQSLGLNLKAVKAVCSVNDHVLCPDGVTWCSGDQCCPGSIACPSASAGFAGCAFPKTVDCTAPDGSIVNDPHVRNLAREDFDIGQPGNYVMLRTPMEPAEPAVFELRAVVQAAEIPCGLYMKEVILSGTWFGSSIVRVRPLKRNKPGSNGAGNRTEWPFSMQVSPGGPWQSFADFKADGGSEVLTGTVKLTATEREEFGGHLEGQTFTVHIGKTGQPASIQISQAQHQALNMDLMNIQALGQRTLGGLLGTEKHDKGVELITEACKEYQASHETNLMARRIPQDVSRLSASWV